MRPDSPVVDIPCLVGATVHGAPKPFGSYSAPQHERANEKTKHGYEQHRAGRSWTVPLRGNAHGCLAEIVDAPNYKRTERGYQHGNYDPRFRPCREPTHSPPTLQNTMSGRQSWPREANRQCWLGAKSRRAQNHEWLGRSKRDASVSHRRPACCRR